MTGIPTVSATHKWTKKSGKPNRVISGTKIGHEAYIFCGLQTVYTEDSDGQEVVVHAGMLSAVPDDQSADHLDCGRRANWLCHWVWGSNRAALPRCCPMAW